MNVIVLERYNGASGIANSVPNKNDDQNVVLHLRGVNQQQHSVN